MDGRVTVQGNQIARLQKFFADLALTTIRVNSEVWAGNKAPCYI